MPNHPDTRLAAAADLPVGRAGAGARPRHAATGRAGALLVDLGAAPVEVPVGDLPDTEPVCTCTGVTKGTVVATVHSGLTGIGEVVGATRAGA
jgi:NAD(P)H-nitrite reductase large subunit